LAARTHYPGIRFGDSKKSRLVIGEESLSAFEILMAALEEDS